MNYISIPRVDSLGHKGNWVLNEVEFWREESPWIDSFAEMVHPKDWAIRWTVRPLLP